MKPETEALLVAEAMAAQQERREGFSLRAMHALHKELAAQVLQHGRRLDDLERAELPPGRLPYQGPLWTGVDVPERLPSDRAASISMSAPFGVHAGFKGRGPTRFAMALLVLVAIGGAGIGWVLRTSVHEAPVHAEHAGP